MKDINQKTTDSTNRIPKRKDVLTTSEVSRICNVSPRTVCRWFDSGQLRGYRIIATRGRRIPVTELVRFIKAHNMPMEMLCRQ